MPELILEKSGIGLLPADEESEQILAKLPACQPIKVKFSKVRNTKFHRKAMALFGWAFERWEPPKLENTRWSDLQPERNFDRFRKDLTILAGFYEAHYRLNGEVRIEAKSLAFDQMEDDEFHKVYSAVIDAIIKNMFKGMDRQKMLELEQQLLSFM
jgi:hypothetical protein